MTLPPLSFLDSIYNQSPETQIKFVMTLLYSILENTTLHRIDSDFLGFFEEENDLHSVSEKLDGLSDGEKTELAVNLLAIAKSKI